MYVLPNILYINRFENAYMNLQTHLITYDLPEEDKDNHGSVEEELVLNESLILGFVFVLGESNQVHYVLSLLQHSSMNHKQW